jgi:hypothetical protein
MQADPTYTQSAHDEILNSRALVHSLGMRHLMLLLLVAACTRTTEVRNDEHHEERETVQSTTEASSSSQEATTATETRTQAPTEVATNIERKELAVVTKDATGAVTIARVGPKPVNLPPGSIIIGTVPLSDTTTARDEHRGPVVDEKASSSSLAATAEAKGASTAAKAKTDDSHETGLTETRAGTSWLLWLGIGAGLVVAVLVLWKLGKLALLAKWAGGL